MTTDNILNNVIVIFSDCTFEHMNIYCEDYLFSFNNITVHFNHCSFIRNSALIRCNSGQCIAINHCLFRTNYYILRDDVSLISIKTYNATIRHSTFNFNFRCVLQAFSQHYNESTSNNSITMQSVTFHDNSFITKFIQVSNTQLRMIGSILFFRNVKDDHNTWIHRQNGSLIQLQESTLFAHGYIEFSNNNVVSISLHNCNMDSQCFSFGITKYTTINITSNTKIQSIRNIHNIFFTKNQLPSLLLPVLW